MCRMICAAGRLDFPALRAALVAMAGNANPGHAHEHSGDRAYRHEDGWGAVWRDRSGFHLHRSVRSVLEDPEVVRIDGFRSDLLLLHARRATDPGTISLRNTHPFLVEWKGQTWAFCHNGAVHSLDDLDAAPGLDPVGEADSERLFHHLLAHLDESDPERSLIGAVAPLRDFTATLCFLAGADSVIALSHRHPVQGLPEYHALWEGTGPNLRVVSSERLEGIGCNAWTKIPAPGAVRLDLA